MRLIDADALKERAIRVATTKFPHVYFKAVGTREIDKQPTVDPVVHGRWIFGTTLSREWMKCSECLKSQTPTLVFSYCPNCGAKMDKED